MIGKTKAQEWAEIQVAEHNPPAITTPLDLLSKILALADDPKSKAARQFLSEVALAHSAAGKTVMAELARLKGEHDDEAHRRSQEHSEAVARDVAQLAKDRTEFGNERAKIWDEINAARKTLEADRASVDALKKDYEARQRKLRALATDTT